MHEVSEQEDFHFDTWLKKNSLLRLVFPVVRQFKCFILPVGIKWREY
jgi:hypothetical protein